MFTYLRKTLNEVLQLRMVSKGIIYLFLVFELDKHLISEGMQLMQQYARALKGLNICI